MTISLTDLQMQAMQQQRTGRPPLFSSYQAPSLGAGLPGMATGAPQADMIVRMIAQRLGMNTAGVQTGFLNDGLPFMAAARAQALASGNAPSLAYAQRMLGEMNARKEYAAMDAAARPTSFAAFTQTTQGRSAMASGSNVGGMLGSALPFLMPFMPGSVVGEIMAPSSANAALSFQYGTGASFSAGAIASRLYETQKFAPGNRDLFGYGVGRSLQGMAALQQRGMLMGESGMSPAEELAMLASNPEAAAAFVERAGAFTDRGISAFDAYREPLSTLSGRLGIGGESIETQFQALEQVIGGDLSKLNPEQVKQRVAEFDKLTEITGIAADKLISFIQSAVDMAERYGRSGAVAARSATTNLAQARFAMSELNSRGVTADASRMADFYNQSSASYSTSAQYNSQLAAQAVFLANDQSFSGELGEIQQALAKRGRGEQLSSKEMQALTQANIENAFRRAPAGVRDAFSATMSDQFKLNDVAETGIGEKLLEIGYEFQMNEQFSGHARAMRAYDKSFSQFSLEEIQAGLAVARVRKPGDTGALDVGLLTSMLGDEGRAAAVSRQFGSAQDILRKTGRMAMTPEQARAFIARNSVASRVRGFEQQAEVTQMFSAAAGRGDLTDNALKLLDTVLNFDPSKDVSEQMSAAIRAGLGIEGAEDIMTRLTSDAGIQAGAADIDASGDSAKRRAFMGLFALTGRGSASAEALVTKYAESGSLVSFMNEMSSRGVDISKEMKTFLEGEATKTKEMEKAEADAKAAAEEKKEKEREKDEQARALSDIDPKAANLLIQLISTAINESRVTELLSGAPPIPATAGSVTGEAS
jgi:hypothetical protein